MQSKITAKNADSRDFTNSAADVNSLALIQQVIKQKVLYDNSKSGFHDQATKDNAWEQIHQVLFPDFECLCESRKENIRKNIRKRWKSLRDSLIKEIRKNKKNPKYAQRIKRKTTLVDAMQDLIPFIDNIRFPRAKHIRQSVLFSSVQPNTLKSFEEPEGNEADNNYTIDLTTFDKPVLKADICNESFESIDENDPKSSLYPVIEMLTENPYAEHATDSERFTNGYCVTQHIDGEFAPSIVYTAEDLAENTEPEVLNRPPTEFQERLFEILSNSVSEKGVAMEQETRDEDRMFLLSMVSDLKNIPTAKKMRVKAEIITAIARGVQHCHPSLM